MKVLVTGAKGQLGQDIVEIFKQHQLDVIGFSREELDITSKTSVQAKFREVHPDVVIHTAAYTQVDQAESDEEQAFRVNALGTAHVAQASEEVGAKCCYLSTDYVFDGKSTIPYRETDIPNPLGIYGKSKLAGEQSVMKHCSRYFIVRTSWVYGKHGHNFVKTMLRLATGQDVLNVVYDQVGSPTYTIDLVYFLLELVQTDKYGVYHASNSGVCSWYEFAKTIFALSNIHVQVTPLTTQDFPRPAPRPQYSVLDHQAIREHGLQPFRHWKEALQEFLQEIRNENED